MRSRILLTITLGIIASSPLMKLYAQNDSSETAFSRVYEQGEWGVNEKGEGVSGSGSKLANAVEYIAFLLQFLEKNKIQSVVDIGCGDWELSRHIDWRGIQYIGFDVVKSVIEKNKKKYASPSITFICTDVTKCELPKADLLICKDVMQHLTNADILMLSQQFSKFTHCIITNDINPVTLTSDNRDIPRGDLRELDLTKPPFNFKAKKVLTYRSAEVVKQVIYLSKDK